MLISKKIPTEIGVNHFGGRKGHLEFYNLAVFYICGQQVRF